MKRTLSIVALAFLVTFLSPALADEAKTSPADDLRAMQGSWKVKSSIGGATSLAGETPEFIQNLGNDRLQFQIAENQLSFSCIRTISGKTAVLANNLPLSREQEQLSKSIAGDRLLMLTLPTGEGLLASYRIAGDSMTIRYPAGCCSRSGNVIWFERVK